MAGKVLSMLLAAGLAGCGGSASVPAAGPPAATQSVWSRDANPVVVLRGLHLAGCKLDAGEMHGTIGLDDDMVAGCTFSQGEMLSVFTYPSAAYRDNRWAHPMLPPADGTAAFKGPGASIVTLDEMGGTYDWQKVVAEVRSACGA